VEDQVQVLLGRRPPPQGVVLVAMPRAAYGQVAKRLLEEGPAVVGQIGSPRRMEFTVIGDTVNRGARLESLTRQLGAPGAHGSADGGTAGGIFGAARLVGWAHSPWLPAVPRGGAPMQGPGDGEVFSPPEEAAGSACAGPGR
jgi:hypothetical protein